MTKQRPPRSRKPVLRRLGHRLGRMWHEVVTQHDAPHRIALGVALGFLIGWLPIVGVQMLASVIICWLLRANFLASLPGIWLSNPLTMVPMYWLENRLGSLIAGQAITIDAMRSIWGQVAALLEQEGFWSGTWSGTKLLFTEFYAVTVAMFIGGTIIGLINAVIVYMPALRMVQGYHRRRLERKAHWHRSSQRHARADRADQNEPTAAKRVESDKEAV